MERTKGKARQGKARQKIMKESEECLSEEIRLMTVFGHITRHHDDTGSFGVSRFLSEAVVGSGWSEGGTMGRTGRGLETLERRR